METKGTVIGTESETTPSNSLRKRILAAVFALVVLSLLGSLLSLYRITEVNRALDAINRVSVPLGQVLVQLKSDGEILQREMERRLGFAHWENVRWRPQPIPRWISDVIQHELQLASDLSQKETNGAPFIEREKWKLWVEEMKSGFVDLQGLGVQLYLSLEQRQLQAASQIYPRWLDELEKWVRQLKRGAQEFEGELASSFGQAQKRVQDLKTGLQVILIVVVFLSLLLFWLGERALRPLGELTQLVRDIRRRGGIRKEDKANMPLIFVNRSDEVSQLAREFHGMATTLLEREKMVDFQKNRLEEQNRLLREMGALNKNVLNSIDAFLIVTNLKGEITQCNPSAVRWLEQEQEQILGSQIHHWAKLQPFVGAFLEADGFKVQESTLIEKRQVDAKVFGGYLMPLKQEDGEVRGSILVLEDLTSQEELEYRLRSAEHLAAVGRMSAQVAHEVRNPLHSIGLEAEMVGELLKQHQVDSRLRQSVQSILVSVDRLEKITENYLKFSRLSQGQKHRVHLGEILQNVLALYSPLCESQGVSIDWTHDAQGSFEIIGDPDLLEQVLGNLLRNALQALEVAPQTDSPQISWHLDVTAEGHVRIRIEDNGPGLSDVVRSRLFTPFVTTRAQGTGLGLSFAKRVVEEHQGEIAYRERESSNGACFELVFPPAPPLASPSEPDRDRGHFASNLEQVEFHG